MKPLLFAWGPLRVYGYGAMAALGFVLGFWLLRRRLDKIGLKSDEDFWLFVNIVIVSAPLGGRIMYLIEYTKLFSPEFWDILVSPSKGFSMFGALLGVPLGLWAFSQWKGISLMRLLDGFFTIAPLWHAFGRVGCLLAGCCHGRPTHAAWGLVFTDPSCGVPVAWRGVPLYPTQPMESLGDLVIFAFLHRIFMREQRPGLATAVYFASYGTLRFLVEFLRGDTVPIGLALTAGQVFSLGLVIAAGGILFWRSQCCRPC